MSAIMTLIQAIIENGSATVYIDAKVFLHEDCSQESRQRFRIPIWFVKKSSGEILMITKENFDKQNSHNDDIEKLCVKEISQSELEEYSKKVQNIEPLFDDGAKYEDNKPIPGLEDVGAIFSGGQHIMLEPFKTYFENSRLDFDPVREDVINYLIENGFMS